MCQLHLFGINPLGILYGILVVKQILAKLPSKYCVIYFEKGNISGVLQVKYFRYVKPCELLSPLTHRLIGWLSFWLSWEEFHALNWQVGMWPTVGISRATIMLLRTYGKCHMPCAIDITHQFCSLRTYWLYIEAYMAILPSLVSYVVYEFLTLPHISAGYGSYFILMVIGWFTGVFVQSCRVYPMEYADSFVVLCFVVVILTFYVD